MNHFTMPLFSVAMPDIFMLCMAAFILLVDVFLPERRRVVTYYLVQLTLLGAFLLAATQYGNSTSIVTFSGNYIVDKLAVILKMFICIVSVFVFAYSREYIRVGIIIAGTLCHGGHAKRISRCD
jgi:NADH-quinone oxidoreductase subunit N